MTLRETAEQSAVYARKIMDLQNETSALLKRIEHLQEDLSKRDHLLRLALSAMEDEIDTRRCQADTLRAMNIIRQTVQSGGEK